MSVYEIKDNNFKKEIILRCSCSDQQHQLDFGYFPEDDDGELYIEITLNNRYSFFRKFIIAFKYLFGWPGKFGPYEESLFLKEDVNHLVEFLNKYLAHRKNNDKSISIKDS